MFLADWFPWDEIYHHGPPFGKIHSPKTNISTEKCCLEDFFPLEMGPFQGKCSSLSVYFLELVPSASKPRKSKKIMGLEEGSGGSFLAGPNFFRGLF